MKISEVLVVFCLIVVSTAYGRKKPPQTCPVCPSITVPDYNPINTITINCNRTEDDLDILQALQDIKDLIVKEPENEDTTDYCNEDITCEGNTLSIECPSGRYIDVEYAMYGRDRGPYICPSSAIRLTQGCQSDTSLSKVWEVCQGRSSCEIGATNSVFGDPCVGTYKFLRVEYVCGTYTRARVCEHATLRITCPTGQTITIMESAYGRNAGSEVCPHPSIRQISNCRASSSLSVVTNACDGRNSCSVAASNGVFGDPCVGTFKYLEVQYRCS